MNVLARIARELRVANLLTYRDSLIKGGLEWQQVTEQIDRELGL